MGAQVPAAFGIGRGVCYVGPGNVRDWRCVLRHRCSLREGLQPALEEGAGKVIEPVLLIVAIVLLMAYLIFALLRPEKF